MKNYLFALFLLLGYGAHTQHLPLTPYDHLPAINPLEKPAYDRRFPSWAKMLYRYPVNYLDICRAYDSYSAKHPGEKSAIRRYFIHWRQAVEEFAQEDGRILLPGEEALFRTNKKALIGTKTQKQLNNRTDDDPSQWTFLGPKQTVWRRTAKNRKGGQPAPWQANVYSFDVAPSDPEILYCGTETGFLNKTTDRGQHWQLMAPHYRFNAIQAIAIDPSDANHVLVSGNSQIHVSRDGGNSFEPVLDRPANVSRLQFHTSQPHLAIGASSKGILVSKDTGQTWQFPFGTKTWDVDFKPDNPDILYGISGDKGGNFQFVLSKDGGNTFIPDPAFPTLKVASGALLAVPPADPDLVYVSLLIEDNGAKYPVIYKGIWQQGALKWSKTYQGVPSGFGRFSNGQGYYDFVFGVSPDRPNIVFWGTTSFWKSTDGARSFKKVGGYGGAFGIHPDMQDIKVLPDGKVWVSTDGGINYSTDNFTNPNRFHPLIKGLVGSHMWGFDQSWNEDLIVGGRYHNGNTALSDTYDGQAIRMGGAESPTGWILHTHPRQAAFSDINKGYTTSIPKTTDEVVYDRKYHFSKFPNMKGYGARRGNLVHHPWYSSTLYVGTGKGFWMSKDMGATWDLLHEFDHDVMFFDISHQDPDVLYLNAEQEGLYRSEDGGLTWEQKNNGLPSGWDNYLHFVLSPYDANKIYLIHQKHNVTPNTKVLRSSDGGTTWQDWSANIPVASSSKMLAIQPTDAGEDLLYLFNYAVKNNVSVRSTVWYRKEGMPGWSPFANDYPANIRPIYASPFFRDGKLRVASNAGIWESPLAEPVFAPPYITPWVDRKAYRCLKDTIYLNDHSMLNHSGAQWHWDIHPAPLFLSSPDVRNPKMLAGENGQYSVTLTVSKDGETYTRTMQDLFEVKDCAPSSATERFAVISKAMPIPATDRISVRLPEDGIYAFVLYEMAGHPAHEGQTEVQDGTAVINLSTLRPGVYFLLLRHTSSRVHYRLKIVKR